MKDVFRSVDHPPIEPIIEDFVQVWQNQYENPHLDYLPCSNELLLDVKQNPRKKEILEAI